MLSVGEYGSGGPALGALVDGGSELRDLGADGYEAYASASEALLHALAEVGCEDVALNE